MNLCCENRNSKKELEEIADFLKNISEENRLKILCMLKDGERCVCEIWQNLNIPQNLASHHLKVLKEYGLISSRREGLKIFYSINQTVMETHLQSINKFLNHNKKL